MYKVVASSVAPYRFSVRSKDGEVVVDAKGGSISPPDTFLAGLASCVGVYVRKYADGAKIGLEDFTITAEADLGSAAPYQFREISVSIDLKGAGLDERRKTALIEFVKNCPMHNTLRGQPAVDIRIQ
jgi:uncharacterized OsmC-like protein